MNRYWKDKLRSRAGETIAETLIALLISAVALVMLAGAVSTATRIITQSEDTMQAYYQENNKLATPSNSPAAISIKDSANKEIKLSSETGSENVKYTANVIFGSKPVVAYVK